MPYLVLSFSRLSSNTSIHSGKIQVSSCFNEARPRMSARAEKPLLSGVDGRPFDFGSGRSCREGLTGCSGSLADDPQKRARATSDKAQVLLHDQAVQVALQPGGEIGGPEAQKPAESGLFTCYKFATARDGSLAGQASRLSFHPLNYGMVTASAVQNSKES